MDNREISEKYAEIGAEWIKNEEIFTELSDVTIVYLSSDCAKMDKGREVLGQCEKIADKYRWGIPADFTITLFEPNIVDKSEEVIKRIIFHELLHVGDDKVNPHDLEDFRECIERWGVDWAEDDLF